MAAQGDVVTVVQACRWAGVSPLMTFQMPAMRVVYVLQR